jgi:hypothetical protein
MTDDAGDKKMQNGEVTTGTSARSNGQRATKPRLSPELQELMHMLSSLEHQFTPENGDE